MVSPELNLTAIQESDQNARLPKEVYPAENASPSLVHHRRQRESIEPEGVLDLLVEIARPLYHLYRVRRTS